MQGQQDLQDLQDLLGRTLEMPQVHRESTIVEGRIGVEASGEVGHDIRDGIHWDEHDGPYR